MKTQKLWDEEVRIDELRFYKSLAQQNLSKAQIDTLLTSYHTEKARSQQQPRWTFHMDPHPHLSPEVPQPSSQPPPYRSEAPHKPVLAKQP